MKSVVVVGAGIVGLCCAWFLNEAGFEVTIVDKSFEDGDNCSQGNSGMIVPSHFVPLASPGMIGYGIRQLWREDSPFGVSNPFDPEFIAWSRKFAKACARDRMEAALPLMAQLQSESRNLYEGLHTALAGRFEFHANGLLSLALTNRQMEHEEESVRIAKQLGLRAELLTGKEALAMDSAMEMDIVGAAFHPDDAHLNPAEFTRQLKEALIEKNVCFVWNFDVDGANHRAGAITSITSDSRRFRADEFVLAAGARVGDLAKRIGLNLPMMAGKGYSVTVDHPTQRPKVPALIPERRLAMTPMSNRIRFGGTMEIGEVSNSINAERVQGILASIQRVYPRFRGIDLERIPVWVGSRPCTPDGFPYIGRATPFGNLTIAVGHAMSGVSLAPITGKLVTQTLLGEKPSIAHPFLDPNRYD